MVRTDGDYRRSTGYCIELSFRHLCVQPVGRQTASMDEKKPFKPDTWSGNGKTVMEKLARLFPTLSSKELRDAKSNLDRYFLLAWDVWEAGQPTLTDDESNNTISERSNESLKS